METFSTSISAKAHLILLYEELKKLRVELLYLLNQWYLLKFKIFPELIHKYDSLFGDLENRLSKMKSLSSKMELRMNQIITKINSKQKVSKSYVVNTFNLKFSSDTMLNLKPNNPDIFDIVSNEYLNKEIINCKLNTEYEFSQIYRKIAKKIHPDLNGESDLFNKYWDNISDAYKTKNLCRLRLFYKLICEEMPDNFPDIRIEEAYLKTQINEFKNSIKLEKIKIKRLMTEEPYLLIDKMNDSVWIKQKRNFLNSEILITELMIKRNKSKLKQLLENSKDLCIS